MVPFKKNKSAKGNQPKSDSMPDRVPGKAQKNKRYGNDQDSFAETVTNTPPRMTTNVKGK
jgi:hypothetical protein